MTQAQLSQKALAMKVAATGAVAAAPPVKWPMPDWMREILSAPTVSVPDAARVLGINRNLGYQCAADGEIKTIRLGRALRVPTTWLYQVLMLSGLEDDQEAGAK